MNMSEGSVQVWELNKGMLCKLQFIVIVYE